MNHAEMLRIIDSIARDRNLDKESLFFDIEQAMISAARKHFNAEDTEDFKAEVDRLTGKIRIWREEEEITLESLGRIPAQTAKQVMIQKFREDERASIYDEFHDRVGELVTGTAQRYEGGALVVSFGRAEGFMPRSEQIPGEQHAPGERVRVMILDCREEGSQVKIVLSRADPDFIRRLFEVEVPEVNERIIELKALAREPGHRTKVAVSSIDSKVDAVGACVGVRGSRIKNIVDELGGEKIDVVRWNESSQVLIANALRPAEIVEISLCFELGRATVVVNEDQLSLAIGKRGQNVRLAARLTGWDVDILTPVEFQKGLDILEETLGPLEGVTEEMIDRMAALGFITVFDVEEVGEEVLVEHFTEMGMTEELAAQMVETAAVNGKVVKERMEKEREEAAERKAQEERELLESNKGEAQAAAILGGVLGDIPAPAPAGPEPTGDIVDILKDQHADGETPAESSGEPDGDSPADEPRDVAVAGAEQAATAEPEAASPAEQEIEQSQDETEVARIAQGDAEVVTTEDAADEAETTETESA